MVPVQVGQYDHVHVLGPEAVVFEILQKLSPRSLRSIRWFRPQTRVHHYGLTVGTYQKAGKVESGLVLWSEVVMVRAPVFLWDSGKEITKIKLKNAIC
jgi:hypothetical protein